MLHGGFSSNSIFMRHFPLYELSQIRGINVVYIEGTPIPFMRNRRVWNAGKCCGAAVKNNIDDVAFIDEVIQHFLSYRNIDARNIYLVGGSNGAMMSYRYACERPQNIMGVFAIGGVFVTEDCNSLGAVKVLHIHGEEDDTIPLQGGGKGVALMGAPFPSLKDTEQFLKQKDAKYAIEIVRGAGHSVLEINAAMLKQGDINLQEFIADIIDKMKAE
jgi:polyhydroxybutyrate depolymerase